MNTLRKKLLDTPYVHFEIAMLTPIFRVIFENKNFRFRGQKLQYIIRRYNSTYSNERMVEIPIAIDYLKRFKGKRILEVGNVLCHYTNVRHEVLDKYEKHKAVTYNEDICTFAPKKKYDLIMSISTLEHVGFDERDPSAHDKKKIYDAFANIIKQGKEVMFTFIMGFNPHLDKALLSGELSKKFGFSFYFMKRVDFFHWKEIKHPEIKVYSLADRTLAIGIKEEKKSKKTKTTAAKRKATKKK